MARKFIFDTALTQDVQTAVSDSFVDNIRMIDVDKIVPSGSNFYNLSDIDTLAEDIERQGLKHNLVVSIDRDNPDKYLLKSGHRRLKAIQLLISQNRRKSRVVPCYIDGVKSKAETQIDLIMLNATARLMSDADILQQYKELLAAYEAYEKDTGNKIKGRMRERIAAALQVSPAQVGKIENIVHNAIPDVVTAVEKGETSISTANEIAKLPAMQQEEIVDKDISSVSYKEVKEVVKNSRKSCNNEQPKNRVPYLKTYSAEIGGLSFTIMYGQYESGWIIAIPNFGVCVDAGEPDDAFYNTEQLENCASSEVAAYAREIAMAVKKLYA